MTQTQNIVYYVFMKYYDEQIMRKLKKSSFRSGFHLKKKDLEYIDRVGPEKIREHAYDFINERLRPSYIENDGRQTPMRNHPVFIAQHATATCCRGCLEKWHSIKSGRELSDDEMEYVVNMIMKWIKNEYEGREGLSG